MEKYRSSADPSTGLHPFLPPARLPLPRILLQGVILFPLRLPAAFALIVLHAAVRSAEFLLPRAERPPAGPSAGARCLTCSCASRFSAWG